MKTVLQPRSLQARLLLMVVGLAALVWLCAMLATWMDARDELDELLDAHLSQSAALLVVQADGDDDDVGDAPVMHKYASHVAFQVYLNGILVTRSTNAAREPMSSVEEGFSTVRQGNTSWRVFGIFAPGRNVQVFVGEMIESREGILWAILRSMLLPFIVGFPLLALAGWWAVHKGLSPVRDVSEAIARRNPQALEPVHIQSLPPELQPLVDALNALLARIGRLMDSERRFTADAAHELRTPIAAIRAQAQVALGAGDNEEERVRALQYTLAGCDRATRLVEQLLTLARLENRSSEKGQLADLGATARRVAAELAVTALGRAQSLELEAESGCEVEADDALLGVLVRNLVDNAMRYSPQGARVVIGIHKDAQGVHLCVQDSGPGMTPEAMQRLGERFFRVLGTDQPGSGLGWSIVRRLAEVFGASVQVSRSEMLTGLSVAVTWPLPAAS
jgi:two-component system sensor histidine kinase QseC